MVVPSQEAEAGWRPVDAYRKHCEEMLRHFGKEKIAPRCLRRHLSGLHVTAQCGFRLVERPCLGR